MRYQGSTGTGQVVLQVGRILRLFLLLGIVDARRGKLGDNASAHANYEDSCNRRVRLLRGSLSGERDEGCLASGRHGRDCKSPLKLRVSRQTN
jgi:hypothetical protein